MMVNKAYVDTISTVLLLIYNEYLILLSMYVAQSKTPSNLLISLVSFNLD